MLHCQPTDKEKKTEPQFHTDGFKILVVEDEAIIAMDIQCILRKIGFADSEVVFSGEESIEKVASRKPHLVLMDIKLRGALDGIPDT